VAVVSNKAHQLLNHNLLLPPGKRKTKNKKKRLLLLSPTLMYHHLRMSHQNPKTTHIFQKNLICSLFSLLSLLFTIVKMASPSKLLMSFLVFPPIFLLVLIFLIEDKIQLVSVMLLLVHGKILPMIPVFNCSPLFSI